MSTPRRRIVRPEPSPAPTVQQQRKVHALRSRLEGQRHLLARWLTRLRRSFHTVERLQAQISRSEKQLTKLENS